jgi:DNA polymerase-3 subunit delta
MPAAPKITFDSLRKEIAQRNFKPIYLLMGDEGYFIDKITEQLSETVLSEAEKDFNMHTFYGVDSDVNTIIASARRFPMMAEYQLIVVKEAQELSKFEVLDLYAKNPMSSTILVLNYKHGTVDGRKAVVKNIDKIGVVFESKKLYDNQIPAFITSYFREKNIDIDDKSAQMLTDFVGNDISKLIPQLEKLEISLPTVRLRSLTGEGRRAITSELIEQNVGISKDYNNFELQKAIIEKNVLMANRIINYLVTLPAKEYSPIATIAILFNYFGNLLECYWLPQKTEQNVMAALGLRSSFQVRDYMTGLRKYNVNQTINAISCLRTYDARLKGVDNVSASQGELLRELVYRIMH